MRIYILQRYYVNTNYNFDLFGWRTTNKMVLALSKGPKLPKKSSKRMFKRSRTTKDYFFLPKIEMEGGGSIYSKHITVV